MTWIRVTLILSANLMSRKSSESGQGGGEREQRGTTDRAGISRHRHLFWLPAHALHIRHGRLPPHPAAASAGQAAAGGVPQPAAASGTRLQVLADSRPRGLVQPVLWAGRGGGGGRLSQSGADERAFRESLFAAFPERSGAWRTDLRYY